MKNSLIQALIINAIFITLQANAQPFTRQDTLRGSITPERAWWDLSYYDLAIDVDVEGKSLKGTNTIYFFVIIPQQVMQIDLQEPLAITHVDYKGQKLSYTREGNVYHIRFPYPLVAGDRDKITIQYEGVPVVAVRPPWDGGLTWSKDDNDNPFVATSCQGLGASVWWPCKDHMYDEPDSMLIRITAPPSLTDVSNGRLRHIDYLPDGRKTFHWFVSNPINNYGVNLNIGRYAHWTDTIHGEKGVLDMDFYVLQDNYDKAREHFKDAHRTIKAFEYWFGPYPFYEDGYKLVEVPYLGMEHQSCVTYGNKYQMGYLGRDLSSTGWGLKWDFIIVHESAHEWWANNITYKDIADMWIHESFANYAESLYLDYHFGQQAASDYVIGTRRTIMNNEPIIGTYNVNKEGSGDMYPKGGNMLHTLRTWIGDDEKWRSVLRGLQRDFYHQTVTTEQIENYIATQTGKDLKAFFNQYLRDTRIPVVEYEMKGKKLNYRYAKIVDGFNMPVEVRINSGDKIILKPTAQWQELKMEDQVKSFSVDPDYYVLYKKAD
ncbi:MAG: M1 family metallopeptidase [Saprospiraceae bacterium]|nr:M1 family metallopeptidase [Candidatus Opimibacter skivensis]